MIGLVSGKKIWVSGIVQGVGFRPFIYELAMRFELTGWVRNTSSGVEIEINGTDSALASFLNTLQSSPPRLARIDQIRSADCTPTGYTKFEILASQPNPHDFLPISPDVTLCSDCQQELFDPSNRRYRYPFINCTNCGPRFSIIQDIPYDRPKTTMSAFIMCPDCEAEYLNPLDRRFHAQPTACPVCGPKLTFIQNGQRLAEKEDALQRARQTIRMGKILAVKGLGGYHLACDAANPDAVRELRWRKKRSDKPFALMAFDLQTIQKHCRVSAKDAELITSLQHPVVLLERLPGSNVSLDCAPGQRTLGMLLPYTPLHLLLLEPEEGYPQVLVMTSGNLSEEPIAYRDDDALQRLAPLADAFLIHDRPIHMRVDDSVARSAAGSPYLIRRARGYAPDPIRLPFSLPLILAAGAELKNTFCLTRQEYAFLSQHIGDLENYETFTSYEEGIEHYQRLFRIQPETVACDLHPDYLATRFAQQYSQAHNLPLVRVQHHHAHLAACLADNGWNADEPVIGLSFDGTGLGIDDAVWGGEVLLGGYRDFQRAFHLKYVPLPGGNQAVRKPARMALAHLWQAGLDWEADLPPVKALCYDERTVLRSMLEHGLNSPPTSSIGRLFDAASALLGICQEATYEGQAAVEMEAVADPSEQGLYEMQIADGILDPSPLWKALLNDWRCGTPVPVMAARFHNSLAHMALSVCQVVRSASGSTVVAVSGGVWQNIYLLNRTLNGLKLDGFTVLLHRQVPPNDGCIALGQALIAAQKGRG